MLLPMRHGHDSPLLNFWFVGFQWDSSAPRRPLALVALEAYLQQVLSVCLAADISQVKGDRAAAGISFIVSRTKPPQQQNTEIALSYHITQCCYRILHYVMSYYVRLLGASACADARQANSVPASSVLRHGSAAMLSVAFNGFSLDDLTLTHII